MRPVHGKLVGMRRVCAIVWAFALVCGCTTGSPADSDPSPAPVPGTGDGRGQSRPAAPTLPQATVTPTSAPREFDAQAALNVVRHLAGDIGPREATSDNFAEAADFVAARLSDAGYDVTSVPVPVPSGVSWGVAVPEGESSNVIADPPGFDPTRPHVVVGAHLDTVPQAPGAEDNASGVAVLIELAKLARFDQTTLPVRFIAFGAEEPRDSTGTAHHFGSQQYVRDLRPAERDALAAMVSLDRVGVAADAVPICTGGAGTTDVVDDLAAVARSIDIAVTMCDDNRASDHWSFETAGLPAARLGSVPYAAYHSADDVPRVVDADQIDRVGRIMWAWLTSPGLS